jgi:hypothetical protein
MSTKSKRRTFETSNLVRQSDQAINDARCQDDRMGPEPEKSVKYVWYFLEFLFTVGFATVLALASDQLNNGSTNYSPERWRILIGVTGLVFVVWFALTLIGAFGNCMNERQEKEQRCSCVFPRMRWGLTFLGLFSGAFIWIYVALDNMIVDEGMSVLTTEEDRRRFRYKLWETVLTLSVYLVCQICDWFVIGEAVAMWTDSDVRCTEATMIKFDKDEYWLGVTGLYHTAGAVEYVGTFIMTLYLGEQLWNHNTISMWSPTKWRLGFGVISLVLLGMAVLALLAWWWVKMADKEDNTKCFRRYICRAVVFLLTAGMLMGGVWYALWLEIDVGRDHLNTEEFRQRYDNILWLGMLLLVNLLWYSTFAQLRCFLNIHLRRAFCKNFHDL